MSRQLTMGSLFAGIGGFDLGFERAGFKTIWQVEIDDYCRRVLARHFPDAERHSDVRECGAHNLTRVDAICAGFPCQDVSIAKTDGIGLDGERSGLVFCALRIIGELRPSFAVLENVANLFNRGIGRVLGGLADIGYDAQWSVISAADMGAPHLRKRVWIVAYPRRAGLPGREQGPRVFVSAPPSFTEHGNNPFGEWGDMDAAIKRLPHINGLSVGMVRTAIKPFGNSVVPQIPEWIARRLAEHLA